MESGYQEDAPPQEGAKRKRDEGEVLANNEHQASTNAPSSVSPQRKPLGDFELFKKSSSGILIWHFGQRAWQVWDPVNMGKDAARDLFWQGVKPILRILHFANHAFLPADVAKYAADEYVYEVFTRDEWAKKLREHQALFNCGILTKVVQGKIVPRWQEQQGYPVRKLPQVGEIEDNKEEARRARKDFFKQQARQDEEAFRTFTQYWPLIDWEVIRKQQTPDDTAVYEWTVNCLASITNIIFKYGLDDPKREWPSTLRGGATQKELTKKRNKYWLELTEKYSNPPFQSILVENRFWEVESDDRNNVSQAVSDQPDDGSELPVAKRPRIPSRQLLEAQNDAAKPKERPRVSAAIVRHVSNAYPPNVLPEASSGQANHVSSAAPNSPTPVPIYPISSNNERASPHPSSRNLGPYVPPENPALTTVKVSSWTSDEAMEFMKDINVPILHSNAVELFYLVSHLIDPDETIDGPALLNIQQDDIQNSALDPYEKGSLQRFMERFRHFLGENDAWSTRVEEHAVQNEEYEKLNGTRRFAKGKERKYVEGDSGAESENTREQEEIPTASSRFPSTKERVESPLNGESEEESEDDSHITRPRNLNLRKVNWTATDDEKVLKARDEEGLGWIAMQ